MILNRKVAQAVSQTLQGLITNKPVYIYGSWEEGKAPKEGVFVNDASDVQSLSIYFDNPYGGVKSAKLAPLFEICKLEQFKENVNLKIGYNLISSFEPSISNRGESLHLRYNLSEGSIPANNEIWGELVNQLNQ